MRSPLITISLALATALVCALAVWSIQRGNLDEIFGAPRSMPGDLLYPEFDPQAVAQIRVSSEGVSAILIRGEDGWKIKQPWDDRADARAAASILQFTQALRVEDAGDVDETNRQATGMRDGAVRVRMLDAEGRRLVDYQLGARTPWLASMLSETPAGSETQTVPTVFIETRDRGRRNHVYICGGDISPLFRDDLRFLRDHRPFYFNPAGIQSIGIATEDGELNLRRESPAHPWRITKPLELGTDVATMRALLAGLFDLTAVKLEDGAVLAAPDATNGRKIRVSLVDFSPEGVEPVETKLEVRLPEDTEARFAPATVSDRPGITFLIPVKPETDLISLAELPLTVNSLRDATLTNLNIASLAAVALRPATGPEIQISREPGRPWIANITADADASADRFPANEHRLFELLNAVTHSRVISFESDAAVDLSPWGLDRPVLSLAFLGRDHQLLEIDFGLDGRGGTFATRRGTSTVTRLEDDFLKAIAVRAFEWRQARVWSVSKVDLQKIIRLRAGKPPELLEYIWQDELWTAMRGDDDDTPELVQTRANFLLDRLEGIECDRWLAADDAAALAALAQPFMRITVFENEIDDIGDRIGEVRRNLGFAVAPEHPGFFYGILLGDAHPFLIAEDTVRALAIPLFDDEASP
jgi:hypothetical protein